MAAKLIGMLQLRRILQLLDNGSKIRSIARDLGISRNTVKAYLPAIARSKLAIAELLALNDEALSALIHEPERGSLTGDTRYQDFQHCLAVIEEELKKTGVTRQLLWQEYRMVHPDGYGYTQFCYHLQEHFKHKDTVMHFVHNPAEKMLIDFAGKTIRYTDEEGKEIKCQVFIAILPYSGYTYVEAVHSQKQDDFVRCLENALIFFGGVPGCIISDNLKSCIKRADRYEPQLTDLLDQFSLYYNTTVSATRVAKPRDKASVEKAVNLTYQRIYAPIRNKAFRCLEDLNAAIREQTKEHHSRRFRQSQESRQYLFETEEKSGLRPLPSSRMQISNTVTAKVQGNYHIVLGQDWHYYSVPYQYTGKEVKVVYTHASVEIYLEHKRIAVHRRNVRRNGYTTIGEHMPENHRHYQQILGWKDEDFLKKAAAISPSVVQAVEQILSSRYFHAQAYNACLGLLRLSTKYTPQRLSAACAMAVKANAVTYKFIHTILQNNMDQSGQAKPTQTSIPFHDNLRGPQAYE